MMTQEKCATSMNVHQPCDVHYVPGTRTWLYVFVDIFQLTTWNTKKIDLSFNLEYTSNPGVDREKWENASKNFAKGLQIS